MCIRIKNPNPTFCRTLRSTCTSVSFGRIPAYHSSDVRGSKSWWWVLNTLIWFGYPIHSLSMKKRPTSTKPQQKTNSSESCIQGKFCGVLGTNEMTTIAAVATCILCLYSPTTLSLLSMCISAKLKYKSCPRENNDSQTSSDELSEDQKASQSKADQKMQQNRWAPKCARRK